MRRAALVCAALALGIFASPLGAQQTVPDQSAPPPEQTAPSVPPAPPPEPQTAPVPPPFPPMPSRAPRHRWVDVGGHRAASHRAAQSHHRSSHARRQATSSQHKLTRKDQKTLRWCKTLSHRQLRRNSKCTALMKQQQRQSHHELSRKEQKTLRWCKTLSHRQLKRNSKCTALMREQQQAAKTTKHRHSARHRSEE